MKSKQDRYREKAKIQLQNVTEETEEIRLKYNSFFISSLIHVNHSLHNCCSLSEFHPPILSGILPLSDETIVRISIGRHRKNSKRMQLSCYLLFCTLSPYSLLTTLKIYFLMCLQ